MEQSQLQSVGFTDKVTFISNEDLIQRRPYRQHMIVAKGLALATIFYLCWSYVLLPWNLSRGGRLPSSQSAGLVSFGDVIPPS